MDNALCIFELFDENVVYTLVKSFAKQIILNFLLTLNNQIMKKLFILGVLFTSLVLSAFPATIIKEVGVDVIYENNDSNVNKFIYS